MNTHAQNAEARLERTPYEMLGGEAAVRRLVDRFYDIMETEPKAAGIRAMHERDLAPMRERLFEFLSGWLGGPSLYFRRPDRKCIVSAHKPFTIGEAERDQWLLCMRRAMAETGVSEEARRLLEPAFFRVADAFRAR